MKNYALFLVEASHEVLQVHEQLRARVACPYFHDACDTHDALFSNWRSVPIEVNMSFYFCSIKIHEAMSHSKILMEATLFPHKIMPSGIIFLGRKKR